eukprot:gene19424-26081_t
MSERARFALRPIEQDSVLPSSGHAGRGLNSENEGEPSEVKRQRLVLQTPIRRGINTEGIDIFTPSTASGMPRLPQTGNGDILEYLKVRGSRVKDLEDELARCKSAHEAAQQEVARKQEQIMRLQASLSSGPSVSGQLAKGLRLEQDVAAAKEAEQRAVQRVREMEAEARATRLEHDKTVHEVQMQVLTAQQNLKNSKTEWTDKLRAVQLAEKLERRKRETEHELH